MADQLFELRRRTFDTPHFRGITFIESEAKTILNKVPGNYLPFNWTINPYRGCTHSCTYCMGGDTPILMGDGRTRPLSELRVGDEIYGTTFDGKYRRYVRTEVLAHWSTVKRAYRISLVDGTELIASADHRFLTHRGWKHVTGSEHGRGRRPFLTTNNEMLGFGKIAEGPQETLEYQRGYLCGMVRGDGHLGSYSYAPRPGRSVDEVHRFRLALADFEALLRTQKYLRELAVETREFVYSEGVGAHREIRAIRTSRRADIEVVRSHIEWPVSPTENWCKGFLAGIFDAEGSRSCHVFRIANSDEEILSHVSSSLTTLGFRFQREDPRISTNKLVTCIRLLGGLSEHMGFFHTVDPVVSRKRNIEGTAIKNSTDLRVVSVEDLGLEMPMFDITTGTGDFIADGVVSHNCFARASHTFLDMDAGRDFETKIVVKVNAPDLLRVELRKKRWTGESIAMGTNTDPYQRCEGKYKLMPRIIEVLTEYRNPFSILTKGTLIMRDIEALANAAEITDVSTAFSIGTLDEDAWARSEPGTPHPRKRLEAVRKLNEAGVPCGVLVAPILPGITDRPEQLREVVEAAIDVGATHVSPILLHLRPKVKDVYMDWLAAEYPDLVPRYEDMYRRSAYASSHDRDELSKTVRDLIQLRGGLKRVTRRRSRRRWRTELEKQKAILSTEQMKLL